MRIRIEAHDLPGRHWGEFRDVHVGVQGRRSDEVLDPVLADVASPVWEFEATIADRAGSVDLRGPHVQGRPGDRFLYLSWGTIADGGFTMVARSKLMLAAVDPDTLAAAVRSGTLVGRVGQRDDGGRPRLAAIRPPAIIWSAG